MLDRATSLVTHMVFVGDGPGRPEAIADTTIGTTLDDVVKAIWSGVYLDEARSVHAWNHATGQVQDVLDYAAAELARLTYDREEAPPWVEAFCSRFGEECWSEGTPVDPNAEHRLGAFELLGVR